MNSVYLQQDIWANIQERINLNVVRITVPVTGMLRCGVRGVCPTQDFLTFCQIEEQFFGSDVCCPFVHLLMLLVIRICPFALVDAGRN